VDRIDTRSLLRPGYAVGVLLIVLPLGDLALNLWPLQPGNVDWRFGSIGLLSGFILTPLIGIGVLLLVAAVLEHRSVLRLVSIVNLVGAGLMVPMVVLFMLDWIQMRALTEEQIRPNVDAGSLKAIVKYVLGALTLGWLGLAGWRASKPVRGSRARAASPLIGTGSPDAS
jgi:hypothetical protein